MANGKIIFGKQSGGQLALVIPDGVDNTEVVFPNSGVLATKQYVDNKSEPMFVANDTRAKTALNASGDAPIYACRAWVNFNGTGTVAIRASGNVSSVIDRGVGQYTVNFITAMGDENYTFSGGGVDDASGSFGSVVSLENSSSGQPKTVGSARFRVDRNNGAATIDVNDVSIIITR